jgi:hypothetical protein
LDTRLGCLDDTLSPDSEPQQIIDAAKYALRNVATLELKAPYWRYIPTPLWTKYVNNMDFFVEYNSFAFFFKKTITKKKLHSFLQQSLS